MRDKITAILFGAAILFLAWANCDQEARINRLEGRVAVLMLIQEK